MQYGMSIKRMVAVWDGSQHSGSALLLLLALADHADDMGVCWPGRERLAQRTRVSPRTVTRMIGELGESGELWILERSGRSCVFVVTIGLAMAELEAAQAKAESLGATNTRGSDKLAPPPQVVGVVRGLANLSTPPKGVETQLCPGGGDISEGVWTQLCPGGIDTAMSPDPSLTVIKDPSKESSICGPLVWADSILPALQMYLPRGSYEGYFRGTEVVAVDDGTWTVTVRDPRVAEFMDKRLRPLIEKQVDAYAPGVRVEFVAREV